MCNKKQSVCVLTSMNVDMTVEVENFPKPGETIKGYRFQKYFGGKGANQAVAASRMGADVRVIGKVGRDAFGAEYQENFRKEGIDNEHITCSETEATGMAFINVDSKGENDIIVVSGANDTLSVADVERAEAKLRSAKVAVSQFEVPMDASVRFFELAKKNGCITICNPAPAAEIPEAMIPCIDILIPNEGELRMITGMETNTVEQAAEAAKMLIGKGMSCILVTLGSKGSLLVGREKTCLIPSEKVVAVDTTAAGDSYVGALASGLALEDRLNDEVLEKCCRLATKAAALTVQRKGAQASLPYLKEVLSF